MSFYTNHNDIPRYVPNPIMGADAYKTGHAKQYPAKFQRAYANMTPRSFKRLREISPYPDSVVGVNFGVHDAILNLIATWHDNFFNVPAHQAIDPYVKLINAGLGGPDTVSHAHLERLHALGRLPLKFWILREGMAFNEGIPLYVISNESDDDQSAWLVNFIEDQLSSEIWKYLTVASVARMFFEVTARAHLRHFKVEDLINFYPKREGTPLRRRVMAAQIHDFSLRGLSGQMDGARVGASHMLYFYGSDNLAAADYLRQTRQLKFQCLKGDHPPLLAAPPATEHSVMCVQYALQGETETVRELITEKYPTGMVSIVADTTNYWHFLGEVLPSLKDQILAREDGPSGPAKVVVRPDSGKPQEVLCGRSAMLVECIAPDDNDAPMMELARSWAIYRHSTHHGTPRDHAGRYSPGTFPYLVQVQDGDDCHFFRLEVEVSEDRDHVTVRESTPEEAGTYETLWKHFGGTIVMDRHGKPLRQINSKVGAIYGDSITPKVADAILWHCSDHRFDPINVFLGVGSYSYQYLTRDTMATAIKLTLAVVDGKLVPVQKTPQGDQTKHSAKGALLVTKIDFERDDKLADQSLNLMLIQRSDCSQEDLDSEDVFQYLEPFNAQEYIEERNGPDAFYNLREQAQDEVIFDADCAMKAEPHEGCRRSLAWGAADIMATSERFRGMAHRWGHCK